MNNPLETLGHFPFEGETPSRDMKGPGETPSRHPKPRRWKSKSNNPVRIYCSDQEKTLIGTRAKRSRLSVSAYCRRAILGKKIVERMGREQLEAYRLLLEYSGLFERLKERVEREDPNLAGKLGELVTEIHGHLLRFNP